jgi:DNA ligase-1
MKRFASLFAEIDQTNATSRKVEAMVRYFSAVPPADGGWAIFVLTGRRLKRLLPYRAVTDWVMAATGLPEWLLSECYAVVGDGAETAALALDQLPRMATEELSLAQWIEDRILPLRGADPEDQQRLVLQWLQSLDRWQRFTLLKLLTGELRVGVSQTLVVRALAEAASLPPTTIAARLMGDWTPSAAWYESLLASGVTDTDLSRPYPFFLASPIEDVKMSEGQVVGPGFSPALVLGDLEAWLIEWKWDGIRAQIVARGSRFHIWSRGEELITDRFPEVLADARGLAAGTVLDGEILAWGDDRPRPFSALQQRIGRQLGVARKARDVPVVFMAFDLLEEDGVDIRSLPLAERRRRLEHLLSTLSAKVAHEPDASPAGLEPLLPFEEPASLTTAGGGAGAIRPSPLVDVASWEHLAALRRSSRERGVEGLMLKRLNSAYGVGRKRGDWWKWKIDPHTIDAVLIYAQPGSGKRASLLTDYTFGLWDGGELVPVAKAYSGLTNEEIAELDRWIRRHTIERFGPVRHVEPVHVFELGFEAIARSSRHRSGVAVRFPRMLRWRRDKRPADADTMATLEAMIPS